MAITTSLKSLLVLVSAAALLQGCSEDNPCGAGSGVVKDEALCVGRTADTLQGADEDYYAEMDYGISQRPAE